MSTRTWTVHPIELARRSAHRSWFFYLTEQMEPLEIAYRVWLLRSGDECVLVDTGPPLDEGARRGLRAMRSVDAGLADHGLSPADIDTVVLTHLHWDHASSADRFERATFHVQRDEVEFFNGEAHAHPATARFFSHRDMLRRLLDSARVEIVDGDLALREGMRLVRVGGHTPGSQMVVLDTAEGTSVITGDAVPLNRNYTDFVPNGILVNVVDAVAAIRRVRALGASTIHTGHDVEPALRIGERRAMTDGS